MYLDNELLAEKRVLKELYALQDYSNTTYDIAIIEYLVDYKIRKRMLGFIKKYIMSLI